MCVFMLQFIYHHNDSFFPPFSDVIYTTLYMYGVAGLPVINSFSLATELILQVCKCQRQNNIYISTMYFRIEFRW